MSKICTNPECPEYGTLYNDSDVICGACGTRLVSKPSMAFNLGDANAISGGVKIDQSKNVSSHDTHYHQTTIERAKSDNEIRLDAVNQLRAKAEEIMESRGRIDSVAMGQLRPLAQQLGIDNETFKSVIKDVRSNRNGGASGLSAANARYLLQAQQAIQTNDLESLSNLTPRLEAMAAISQDDNVQYLYHLSLSILYPIKSVEVYERQTDENYWRTFWAIVSYVRTGKDSQATTLLAQFDPLRYEKSEEDQNLLEAYFNLMKDDKDGAQEFLDEIIGEPTSQIKPLLRAIECTLYEDEAESLEIQFYRERILVKSDAVVASKKEETSVVKKELIVKPKKETSPVEESKKVEKEQTVANPTPQPTQTPKKVKVSKEADDLYAQASSATGAKRVMLLQKAAAAGSVEAMFDLSDCYYDGEGVDKNMALAIKWLQESADKGYALAQAALGTVYFEGMEGLEQNYALSEKYLLMAAEKGNNEAQAGLACLYVTMEEYSKSMSWARKASQNNNPLACYMLGRLYNEGLGVESDMKEALKWFEKAADNGDADAQNLLGNAYANGDFVEQDKQKAFDYYQKAAAQGHSDGMWNLACAYSNGEGVPENMELAEEWLRKAADVGQKNAIDLIKERNDSASEEPQAREEGAPEQPESELEQAFANFQKGDYASAVTVFRKYAKVGDLSAMNALGYCFETGCGVQQNTTRAVVWYNKAAKEGFALAQQNLGELFSGRSNHSVDYQESSKWYRKAATQGLAWSQYKLAMFYKTGDGVVADVKKYQDWLQKAVDQGLEEAIAEAQKEGVSPITSKKSQGKNNESQKSSVQIKRIWVDNAWDDRAFRVHCCISGEKSIQCKMGVLIQCTQWRSSVQKKDFEACRLGDWGDGGSLCFEGKDLPTSVSKIYNCTAVVKIYDNNDEVLAQQSKAFKVKYESNMFSKDKVIIIK